jgi:hypothetical protein
LLYDQSVLKFSNQMPKWQGESIMGNETDAPHHGDARADAGRLAAHTVEVTVNEQPVLLTGKIATGAQIKGAAIAQGVAIQQSFVLQEELPNGTSKIVGDNDELHLRPHLRFTAIAPDDNS